MASLCLQLLAFALAFCGASGVLAATLLPSWMVSLAPGSGVITAVVQLRGLWMDCTGSSTGMFGCTLSSSVLALPAHVQAARAAMVLACVLAAAGTCAAAAGLPCVRLGGGRESKSRAALAGGLCLVAAGVSGLIPTVWYTREIIADFLDLAVPESSKQEPGGAVYTGFLAALLLLVSGAMFCTFCLKQGPEAWPPPPTQQRPRAARPEGGAAYHLRDYV